MLTFLALAADDATLVGFFVGDVLLMQESQERSIICSTYKKCQAFQSLQDNQIASL
jgi:hypothetical protein